MVLLVCSALVSANEECADNCAAQGSALLQAKSSSVKAEDVPDLADMEPGTAVEWTSSKTGRTYEGEVLSAEMKAMVQLSYTYRGKSYEKWVPAEDVEVIEEDEEEDEEEGGGGGGDNPGLTMSVRQKIVCDMCLRSVRDCSYYTPSSGMLNPVRPPPETPNGRFFSCSPSERELWTTDDRFKVVEDGTPGEGDRTKCPLERRANKFNGKLYMSRKICKPVGVREPGDSCSDFTNKNARIFGRTAVCTASVLSMYE